MTVEKGEQNYYNKFSSHCFLKMFIRWTTPALAVLQMFISQIFHTKSQGQWSGTVIYIVGIILHIAPTVSHISSTVSYTPLNNVVQITVIIL